MKKFISMLLVCFCVVSLFGCAEGKTEEEKVLDFYQNFLDAHENDAANAIETYVHYESEENKALALENSGVSAESEIQSVEKLSDQLWVIQVYEESVLQPDGHTFYNFVGTINGEYKVMRSVRNIPAELAGEMNLDAYLPTGDYISPEDVIDEADQ